MQLGGSRAARAARDGGGVLGARLRAAALVPGADQAPGGGPGNPAAEPSDSGRWRRGVQQGLLRCAVDSAQMLLRRVKAVPRLVTLLPRRAPSSSCQLPLLWHNTSGLQHLLTAAQQS